ncbi:MAG: hypothetical protein ACYCSN_10540 [Acidobacteriaceae bacterium]
MTMVKPMFRALSMSMAAIALCCATLLITPVRARAQDAPSQDAPSTAPMQGRGRRMMNPKEQLNRMSKQLALTDDQKPKVRAILEDRQKQMQALRADTSLTPADRRPKMMAIMQGSDDKIKALLTDEQKTKFDTMMSQMRGRRGGPGGPPPSTPPQ